ncbi:MAG: hypothetical protein WKG01_35620 [Kofleriaceae bacterium]
MVPLITGCPGGDGAVGEPCNTHRDCSGQLQCAAGVCALRCQRAPECGDGFACDADGLCVEAEGQPGAACTSETACEPGLSCQIDDNEQVVPLIASCTEQNVGQPPGSLCDEDLDCRNGTCALGHCVDLCDDTRDCSAGSSCMAIPRVEDVSTRFSGCLPSHGTVTWSIPMPDPAETIVFPVPSGASSASLVFRVDDGAQLVGALNVTSPSGRSIYNKPCTLVGCNPEAEFYANLVRHQPALGQSVLAMPSTPSEPLELGPYRVDVASMRSNGAPGTAIPQVTAVIRIDSAVQLDLHFYFLDLDDHPCKAAFGDETLDARSAEESTGFQSMFLGELRTIMAHGGIGLGTITYEDLHGHPDLDGLDIADAGALLELGAYPQGINVFFVRTLSPVGLQAFGPNPGPGGLANTPRSGIAISADTLCYRSWNTLARLTAHEMARYMGLYHNVEPDPQWRDKIDDSDASPTNLMFYSELGGTELSPGQREILKRSPVLR